MRITDKNEYSEVTVDLNIDLDDMSGPMAEMAEELYREAFEIPIAVFSRHLAAIVCMGELTPVMTDMLSEKLREATEAALEILNDVQSGKKTPEEILTAHMREQIRKERERRDALLGRSDNDPFEGFLDDIDLDL